MIRGEPLDPTLAEPEHAAVPDVTDDEDVALLHRARKRRRHSVELFVGGALFANGAVGESEPALDPLARVGEEGHTRVGQVAEERVDSRLRRDAARRPR